MRLHSPLLTSWEENRHTILHRKILPASLTSKRVCTLRERLFALWTGEEGEIEHKRILSFPTPKIRSTRCGHFRMPNEGIVLAATYSRDHKDHYHRR